MFSTESWNYGFQSQALHNEALSFLIIWIIYRKLVLEVQCHFLYNISAVRNINYISINDDTLPSAVQNYMRYNDCFIVFVLWGTFMLNYWNKAMEQFSSRSSALAVMCMYFTCER